MATFKERAERIKREREAAREAGLDGQKPLTAKQWAFVRHYVACNCDGERAAKLAGYASAADWQRLMGDARVQGAIAAMAPTQPILATATPELIRGELTAIARSNMCDIVDIDGEGNPTFRPTASLPAEVQRTIKSITIDRRVADDGRIYASRIKYELHDKLRAAELLARHYGVHQETAQGGPQVVFEINLGPPKGAREEVVEADYSEAGPKAPE